MSGKILVDENHAKRVKAELIKAGVTTYGLMKAESRHLPEHVHEDEHIGGVVYGRYEGGSGMIVATDKRVLFLDYKPFYKSTDEIHYDVVSGVSVNKQDGYAGVVMHTRLGDYKLRFVNIKCATHFSHYMEQKSDQIEVKPEPVVVKKVQKSRLSVALSQQARNFLWSHEVAVVSTVDESGSLHGSVIYYASDKNDNVYFVSKDKTDKVKHLVKSPQVALTIYDLQSMQTLQVSGIAHIENDPDIKKSITERIIRPRFKDGHAAMPPILYIPAGDYVIVSVKPTSFKFSDYK